MTDALRYCYFSSEWNVSPHTHLMFELHYLRRGLCRITDADGQAHIFGAENLCIIPPETLHGIRQLSEDVEWASIFFSISRVKKEPSPDYEKYSRLLENGRRIIFPENCEKCFGIIGEWIKAQNGGGEHLSYVTKAYLTLLFVEILEKLESRRGEIEAQAAERADRDDTIIIDDERRYLIEKFVSESYADPSVSLDGIAGALHLSRKQTERIILKLTGSTLNKLVRSRRIEEARLLSASGMPLARVAERVGYRSYSGFYVAYREVCGKPPSGGE